MARASRNGPRHHLLEKEVLSLERGLGFENAAATDAAIKQLPTSKGLPVFV
jgi:hypothetical protein